MYLSRTFVFAFNTIETLMAWDLVGMGVSLIVIYESAILESTII